MRSAPRARRWLSFALAGVVLLTGLVLLSAQAAGTGLAPEPGTDETPLSVQAPGAGPDGSPVVDRLDTWAETKGKAKISQARGGSKHK
jgi:hypothetical protein